MDAAVLIGFLGHSSIHPGLDDYLLAGGVKKRPKKNETTEIISDEKIGVSFEFRISPNFDEESLMPKKSDGRFILESITFLSNFTGQLPYGISTKLGKEEITKILGNPKEERAQIPTATYFRDGLVIIVNWYKKNPKEAFVRFTVPTIYDKDILGM